MLNATAEFIYFLLNVKVNHSFNAYQGGAKFWIEESAPFKIKRVKFNQIGRTSQEVEIELQEVEFTQFQFRETNNFHFGKWIA